MSARSSLLPKPIQLTTLGVQRGHVSYTLYRNVSIAVWIGQATLPAVQCIHGVTKEMIERFPGGHSSVTFVADALPAPTPEAQAELTKTFQARSQLLITGIVLEGSGFWASGLRGMISNSHREAASTASLRITTSIEALVGWFCEEHEARTKVALAPMQLLEVLRYARRVGERVAVSGDAIAGDG